MVATVYVAAALVAAPVIFVAAEFLGHGSARPKHRFVYSLLAGLLWPLLALGLAEFAVIAALGHRAHGPAIRPVSAGDDAEKPWSPGLVGVP